MKQNTAQKFYVAGVTMAMAKIKALFSPSTTSQSQTSRRNRPLSQTIRKNPPRNAEKKPDDDYINPSHRKQSSIDLGSTISPSQFSSMSDPDDVFVPQTQSPVRGNDSITLSGSSNLTIAETQPFTDSPATPINDSHDASDNRNAYSVSMFDVLSQTMPDDMSMPSMFPLPNDDLRQLVPHTASTPIQNPLSNMHSPSQSSPNALQLLVTESQLPPSQTESEKYLAVVQQLICANNRVAQLLAENKKLKEDLNVKYILEAANFTPDERSNRKVSNESQTNPSPRPPTPTSEFATQTTTALPNETLLFRSNGNLSILSNFYSMSFRYKGSTYHCAEQAYQHQMALYHARPDIAHRICSTRTAGQAKGLAKQVKRCEQWHEHKVKLMADILRAKATQCNGFTTSLRNTGSKVLLHNIETDSFWGCGPDLQGTNMMGVLLMELRKELTSKPHGCPNHNPQIHAPNAKKPNDAVDQPPIASPQNNVMAPKTLPASNLLVATANAKKKNPVKRPPPVPSSKEPELTMMLGNSNVRDMATLLNENGLNAESTFFPGGTLNYIRSRIPHLVNGIDPPHIVLMAGDIEIVNGMSPEQVISQYEQTVREIRRVFPWSRLLLVGLAIAGNLQRQQTTRRLNALLQHLATNERLIDYVDNCQSKLRDRIHLSHAAKRSLGHRIATLVKKPHLRSIQRFR